MAKKLVGELETLPGTCGVSCFFDFGMKNDPTNYWGDATSVSRDIFLDDGGGAGWNVAGFINNNECKEVYTHLSKRYKVMFKSPVRTNKNSHHKFFMCVFDMKGRKPKGYTPPPWPFKDLK